MTIVCSISLSYSIHNLPVFVNKVRYQHNQLDVHHSTPMMMPQYDYGHTLDTQQPPMLHTIQQPPSSNSRHVTFPHYSLPTRNHIEAFSPQTPRIPSASHAAPIDFRYPTERRLPSAPSSHDHFYTRTTGISMDNDHGNHRPSVVDSSSHSETSPAAAESGTSPKDTRKETSSVVIACRQWWVFFTIISLSKYRPITRPVHIISRSRKIRCDSTRPICNNCARRSNECEYDLVPKRRGPDKRPGTRQRSCKKRPADGSSPPRAKRKRTSSEQITEPQEIPAPSRVKENMQDSKHSSPIRQVDRYTQDPHLSHPHSGLSSTDVRIQTDPTTHYKVCYFIISSPYLNRFLARDIIISSDKVWARFLRQIFLSSATGRKYHSIPRYPSSQVPCADIFGFSDRTENVVGENLEDAYVNLTSFVWFHYR